MLLAKSENYLKRAAFQQ